MWSPLGEPGLEHLRLMQDDEGIIADGTILRVKDGIPFRAHYKIRCDLAWRVLEVNLNLLDNNNESLRLRADAKGHWTDGSGNPLPVLNGCLEVDISVTPSTNTLAIRRMRLKPGESSNLVVAYIAVPEVEVKPVNQRYNCLELSLDSGLYKYEGLFRGFTANLRVDSDGLVFDYPETFRRVGSR